MSTLWVELFEETLVSDNLARPRATTARAVRHTAMDVAAVRRNQEDLVIRLGTEPTGRPSLGTGEPTKAAQLLHPDLLLQKSWVDAMPRWGQRHPGWIYPASHILKADIRQFFEDLIPLDDDYFAVFHGFEYRLGLIQEKQRAASSGPSRAER